MTTVLLTHNFLASARGLTIADTASATWAFNANTNTLTLTAGGGGASPLTTKGDLYGHSTVDARIPVGADGTVITADSTQALGLKWAAAGGGYPEPLGYAGIF